MGKLIQNDYRLPNGKTHLAPDEIRAAVTNFEWFMANCQQVVNKERQLVPFKLNAFQRRLFETILPMVQKETRVDKRQNIICVKGRQVGASVGTVALINYICAFASGVENLSVIHVFPVGDTVSRFYNQKVVPIISGVHPDLYPTMERENMSASILTHYKDIKGIPRHNYYELVSSGASSIRSSSVNIVLMDEAAFYAHPYDLENAILPAVPDIGFSLILYLSTVTDRKNTYFLDKLKLAKEHPDDWTIIFVPWYFSYPEKASGIDYRDLILDDYEANVIVPAMARDGVERDRWGDCIDWYRRRRATGIDMKLEYPTTLDEVMALNEDEGVFSPASLDKQEENILPDQFYKLVTDNLTGRVEAHKTEDPSPLKIFRSPVYGRRYRIAIDPITAQSDSTDYFSMVVFDTQSHEQMAVFHERGLEDDAYSDYAVALAKIYNNAELCPEINVAAGFVAGVNNRHYYKWFYANEKARRNKEIGLRTTASSKEIMIDKLKALLDRGLIKIHDQETLKELRNFVKKVKLRSDGSKYVRMEAKGKTHDDLAACFWIYAGSLGMRDIEQKAKVGFSIAW